MEIVSFYKCSRFWKGAVMRFVQEGAVWKDRPPRGAAPTARFLIEHRVGAAALGGLSPLRRWSYQAAGKHPAIRRLVALRM